MILKTYTYSELAEQMEIKENTFVRAVPTYLDYLSEFYEFTRDKKAHTITLIKELKPFYPKRKARTIRKQERINILRPHVAYEVGHQPINSAANIYRSNGTIRVLNEEEWGRKERTGVKDVNEVLNQDFNGKNCPHIWVNAYDYEPMTEEEKQAWFGVLDSNFKNSVEKNRCAWGELQSRVKAGEITQQEANELAGKDIQKSYEKALKEFKEKYNITPVNVRDFTPREGR